MSYYLVAELLAGKVSPGSTVVARGWVRSRRDSKAGMSFINVHDGSCFYPIQVVAGNDLSNYGSEITRLTAGCSVIAKGILVESQGKGQQFEIQAQSIDVLGFVEDPESYPIQPKPHTLEYLREVLHLRVRTNTFGAMSRLRHVLAQAIHRFFSSNHFFWVSTPIITGSDCEGAGEMFRVSVLDLANLPYTPEGQIDFSQDFFGKETFLTVSGQLNVESYCLALSKVYTFGPTFRAENSNTSRHLAEFWMVEPEVAFADLTEIATLSEALLRYVANAVLEECPDDMIFFQDRYQKDAIQRLENLASASFERIDYSEAIKLLERANKKFEYPVLWGEDLKTEHERYLAEEWVKAPVIVMNYPKKIKSFYMRLNPDHETVAAMDVLVPGMGEIIGGSQREERLDVLENRMDELLLPKDAYQWYLDLRRYGSVPHSGFGLGFERLLSYVTGLTNVRDVIPFPRTPKRADY